MEGDTSSSPLSVALLSPARVKSKSVTPRGQKSLNDNLTMKTVYQRHFLLFCVEPLSLSSC